MNPSDVIQAHLVDGGSQAGEWALVRVDFVYTNELTADLALRCMAEQASCARIFDPERVAVILDHLVPACDVDSASITSRVRAWAKQVGIRHWYEAGRGGIGHLVVADSGRVRSGDLVVGGDSHTAMLGALGALGLGVGGTDLAYTLLTGTTWLQVPAEFRIRLHGRLPQGVYGKDVALALLRKMGPYGALGKCVTIMGEGPKQLGRGGRLTVANMMVEAGAVGVLLPGDDSGPAHLTLDMDHLEPLVAMPFAPGNVLSVREAVAGGEIPVHQVYIGSCTNGLAEDLRSAARLLRSAQVHRNTRLYVAPGTQSVVSELAADGTLQVLSRAGAAILPPVCGPCYGGSLGILAENENAVATTNRNYIGRMGHPTSRVYLASPVVAAASAVLGRLAGPWEVAG